MQDFDNKIKDRIVGSSRESIKLGTLTMLSEA